MCIVNGLGSGTMSFRVMKCDALIQLLRLGRSSGFAMSRIVKAIFSDFSNIFMSKSPITSYFKMEDLNPRILAAIRKQLAKLVAEPPEGIYPTINEDNWA